jgi:hypothetical protein
VDTLADVSFASKASIALDGPYLYFFTVQAGFVKIGMHSRSFYFCFLIFCEFRFGSDASGTGRHDTLRGFVYHRRSMDDAIPTLRRERAIIAPRHATLSSAIAMGPASLFLFTPANGLDKATSHCLRIIDKASLRESGRVFLKSNSGGLAGGREEEKEHVRCVTAGNFVYLISRAVEVTAAQAVANENTDLLNAALTRFEQLREQLMQLGSKDILSDHGGLGMEASQKETSDSSSDDSASFDSAEEEKEEVKAPSMQFISAKELLPMLGLRMSKIVYLVETYDVSHLEDGIELEPCKVLNLGVVY